MKLREAVAHYANVLLGSLNVLVSIMITIVVLVVLLVAGVYAGFCVVHAINSSGTPVI